MLSQDGVEHPISDRPTRDQVAILSVLCDSIATFLVARQRSGVEHQVARVAAVGGAGGPRDIIRDCTTLCQLSRQLCCQRERRVPVSLGVQEAGRCQQACH